jgi:hypothetical protein
MPSLTPDDLVDLSRWHAIQFRDPQTAAQAVDRYERFLERARDAVHLRGGDVLDWLQELSDRAA